jgi:hypothetical protein
MMRTIYGYHVQGMDDSLLLELQHTFENTTQAAMASSA